MERTVLVVEDDPSIREVLQLALEDQGYRVALAVDGLEALERLERERPALVLLDLMMPRMDGSSLLAELEARGLWPGLPIIVLSAARGSGRWAADIRADAYLAKPFDLCELLDQVERIIGGEASALRP